MAEIIYVEVEVVDRVNVTTQIKLAAQLFFEANSTLSSWIKWFENLMDHSQDHFLFHTVTY